MLRSHTAIWSAGPAKGPYQKNHPYYHLFTWHHWTLSNSFTRIQRWTLRTIEWLSSLCQLAETRNNWQTHIAFKSPTQLVNYTICPANSVNCQIIVMILDNRVWLVGCKIPQQFVISFVIGNRKTNLRGVVCEAAMWLSPPHYHNCLRHPSKTANHRGSQKTTIRIKLKAANQSWA